MRSSAAAPLLTTRGSISLLITVSYTHLDVYKRQSYSRTELDGVVARVRKVLQGAAMMTETEVEIIEEKSLDNKIPEMCIRDSSTPTGQGATLKPRAWALGIRSL